MQKKHSVLLIEDDPTLGRLYNQLLKDAEYQVSWYMSAKKALQDIDGRRFDLILLDIMLPDMNGLEALILLKEKAKETVMLTNLDHSRVLEQVKRKGALGYIIKSDHTPDTFLSAVDNFLTQATTASITIT